MSGLAAVHPQSALNIVASAVFGVCDQQRADQTHTQVRLPPLFCELRVDGGNIILKLSI
jgi:hypothetical protein